LIDPEITECLSGGFTVLMTGDLDEKRTDWNSRPITARGSLLIDYADRNSCLIHGPYCTTTVPYTHNATPDALDIVVVKGFVLPVDITASSALSTDHLPNLTDTSFRSFF
jgi:hypothetical protein